MGVKKANNISFTSGHTAPLSDIDWLLLFSWVSLTCQSRHITLVLAEITSA